MLGNEAGELERVKGIEPSSQTWEAHVLPLNHTRYRRLVCNSIRPPAQLFGERVKGEPFK
jgi:hypothetical protein